MSKFLVFGVLAILAVILTNSSISAQLVKFPAEAAAPVTGSDQSAKVLLTDGEGMELSEIESRHHHHYRPHLHHQHVHYYPTYPHYHYPYPYYHYGK